MSKYKSTPLRSNMQFLSEYGMFLLKTTTLVVAILLALAGIVAIAAKNKDRVELINESSDLIFHLMVLLAEQNINFLDVVKNLKKRHILSEKK